MVNMLGKLMHLLKILKKIRRFVMEGMERNQEHFGPVVAKAETRERENKRNKEVYDSLLVRTESLEKTSQVAQVLRDSGYNCWSMADDLEGFEKKLHGRFKLYWVVLVLLLYW